MSTTYTGTLKDDRTVLYESKLLDGIKPNTGWSKMQNKLLNIFRILDVAIFALSHFILSHF